MTGRSIAILILTGLIIIGSGPALGDDGGRESQFSIGSGARSVGMGGGMVGLVDDATAIFWNQAVLATLEEQEFGFMHATLFEGSMFDAASFAYPHPRLGGFGLSFMRLGTDDIVRRVEWSEEGTFGYHIVQLILGYGRRLEGGFYVGSALKIVNQSLDNNSSYGVGLDVSFYRPLTRKISAGIIFQDIIPPRLRLNEKLETQPHTIMFGIGIKDIRIFRNLYHNFNLALEKPEERSVKLHTGLETNYRDVVDFRIGYDRDNMAFGLGLHYHRVRFDYAYRIMDGITDSHRFGFSFRFGVSVSEKLRRETELADAHGSYLILNDRQEQFKYYNYLADRFYNNDEFDSAYVYYHRALAYREDSPEVLEKIAAIDAHRRQLIQEQQAEISDEELQNILLDNYYQQAAAFFNQGRYVAARAIIGLAQKMEPESSRLNDFKLMLNRAVEERLIELLDRADRAEKEGRLSDAITAYDLILELSPDDLTIKKLKGRVGTKIDVARMISKGVESFYLGRLSSAEGQFNEVIRISPDNLVAQEYLRKIVSLRQQPSVQEDLEKDESVWKIYLNALEYYRNGEYERAIELWEEVLKFYPGNEQTLNNIKQARLRLQSKE
nr:PorV/PorQ family protein [candidate division Zixibacteria bacterium]